MSLSSPAAQSPHLNNNNNNNNSNSNNNWSSPSSASVASTSHGHGHPPHVQLHADLLRWLYSVLLPEYIDPKLAYSHVVQTLTEVPSLKVRTKVFMYPDGRPDLLLSLYGTVPTTVNSTQYRIPVEIWLPKQYPLEAPFAYVTPTDSMVIQPGNHVDANGRCYHPYISYWRNEDSDASLLGMIRVLQQVFAREPPVYARRTPAPASASAISPASFNAPPSQSQPHSPVPVHSAAPPYEHTPSPVPAPAQIHTPHMHSNVSPPQRPPLPPAPGTPSGSSNNDAPAKPPKPPKYSYELSQPVHDHTPVTRDLLSSPSQQFGGGARGGIAPGASSSAPVPRPPNPEKELLLDQLCQRYDYLVSNVVQKEVDTDNDALRQTEALLVWMDSTADKEMADLDLLLSRCDDNEKILKDRIASAKALIADVSKREPPNIDDLICAESIPHNQLYDAVCDDLTIEDTLYALDRALDADRLPLSAYLKHTRALAREQFMARALSLKIAEATGLNV